MAIKSTRIRFISADTPEDITQVVSALPFKVEIKEIAQSNSRWYAFFVIPDHIKEFDNQEL